MAKINWDEIDLLCPDAPWDVEGPRPKHKGRPGRPAAAEPRARRVAVLLTDAEYERVCAFAAAHRIAVGVAGRQLIMERLDGQASPAVDAASEGASYEIPWERRER